MRRRGDTKDPLQTLPGIGPDMARHLRQIGVDRPSDLRGRNPEEMYARSRELHGGSLDRCVLYAYRCAVYYANNEEHDPDLLKWWNWKDGAGVQDEAGVQD